jgi:hypothetical protein
MKTWKYLKIRRKIGKKGDFGAELLADTLIKNRKRSFGK